MRGRSIVSNSGPLGHTMPGISESVMGERLLSAWLRTFMMMVMMMAMMIMMLMMMMVIMMMMRKALVRAYKIFIIAIIQMIYSGVC